MRHWTATAFALSLACPVPAVAGPPRAVEAAYDFYVGGMSIGRVEISAGIEDGAYRARAVMQTEGLLDMMLRGRMEASARGAGDAPADFEPEHYTTTYSSRMDGRTMEIDWAERRPAALHADPPFETRDYDVDPLAQDGTLDPVSGLAAVFLPGETGEICNRTIPIFDGRRRFDLILAPPGDERDTERAPTPDWPAPLIRCMGVYERIAGFEPSVIEKGRFFPFDIWFEIPQDGVSRAIRIGGKTRLGYAIGTLDQTEAESRTRTGAKLTR